MGLKPHWTRLARELIAVAEANGRSPLEAEVVACWEIAKQLASQLSPVAWTWVQERIPAQWRAILSDPPPTVGNVPAVGAEYDALATFYEQLHRALRRRHRTGQGVYYTPPAIARHLLRAVDHHLRQEFDCERGLISAVTRDDLPFAVLDPALGSGVFLTELIHALRREIATADHWQAIVERLLPRLGGIEISPAAAIVAVIRIAQALTATGYRFETPGGFQLAIGDALAMPLEAQWNIILGNPPFSGIATTKHSWLHQLLRGVAPDGRRVPSYFHTAGLELKERKHWLLDDYVQFMRTAQDAIDRAGYGIAALVTNHGYLENVTFRGMRAALSETFPRVDVIDLHGNANNRERTPAGERDENVFSIASGVALGIFRRPAIPLAPQVRRADVWGLRSEKLARLDEASLADLEPVLLPPDDWSAPWQARRRPDGHDTYAAGWPLDSIFLVHTTAPVTARDELVVAFTREELLGRWQLLADETVSDDALRARFFSRARSRKYPPGDTRGWKLPAAREQVRAVTDPAGLIQLVQYRAGDMRYVFWAPWLIDWPRSEAMRHVTLPGNLTLIARRQAPVTRPFRDVWLTRALTLDGVIRSDNRGCESLFPLWVADAQGNRVANLKSDFVGWFGEHVATSGVKSSLLTPESIFASLYAVLHAPWYRRDYGEQLSRAFPRLPRPKSAAQLECWTALGARLIAAHAPPRLNEASASSAVIEGEIAAGFPKYASGSVWLNRTAAVAQATPDVWQLMIGSHQPAMKFWKDRRGRAVSAADVSQFHRLLHALAETLEVQRQWGECESDAAR